MPRLFCAFEQKLDFFGDARFQILKEKLLPNNQTKFCLKIRWKPQKNRQKHNKSSTYMSTHIGYSILVVFHVTGHKELHWCKMHLCTIWGCIQNIESTFPSLWGPQFLTSLLPPPIYYAALSLNTNARILCQLLRHQLYNLVQNLNGPLFFTTLMMIESIRPKRPYNGHVVDLLAFFPNFFS